MSPRQHQRSLRGQVLAGLAAVAILTGGGVGIWRHTLPGSGGSGGAQTPWTSAVVVNYTCAQSRFAAVSSAGAANGTSWANAWSLAGINWTTITNGLASGHSCLFIDGGSTSASYSSFTVGASGNDNTHRIVVLSGQDAGHNGKATFSGGITLNNLSYVTVDGEGADATTQHFVFGNDWTAETTSNVIGRYIELDKGSIVALFGTVGAIWDHFYMHNIGDGNAADSGLNCNVNTGATNAYNQESFQNSHMMLASFTGGGNAGSGPDGMSTCRGLTVTNSLIEGQPLDTYTGTQHQDGMQVLSNYLTFTNNVCKDLGDSCIDWDCTNAQEHGPNHFLVYNNVFIKNRGGALIRFYFACTSFSDLHIDNNTFIDHANTEPSYGAVVVKNPTTNPTIGANVEVKNNVFYNDTISPPIEFEASSGYVAADWNIDYNNLSGGTGAMTVDGASYTQSHPSTCAPTFTSYHLDSTAFTQTYSQWAGSIDYSPAAADTCMANTGTSLASIFTTDINGNSRPQGATWDLGAYERVGG